MTQAAEITRANLSSGWRLRCRRLRRVRGRDSLPFPYPSPSSNLVAHPALSAPRRRHGAGAGVPLGAARHGMNRLVFGIVPVSIPVPPRAHDVLEATPIVPQGTGVPNTGVWRALPCVAPFLGHLHAVVPLPRVAARHVLFGVGSTPLSRSPQHAPCRQNHGCHHHEHAPERHPIIGIRPSAARSTRHIGALGAASVLARFWPQRPSRHSTG